ncbi:hypothetical protein B0H14DRAFT_2744095, partial [Mycena olivaceomarginata]
MRRLGRRPLRPRSIRTTRIRVRLFSFLFLPTRLMCFLFFRQPARARVSGSRLCSPLPPPLLPGRKGASQRRRGASPPTPP